MAKSKIAKFKRRRKNPSNVGVVHLAYDTAAAFAGYGATRFVARAIYASIVKRWPRLAPHAGVIASLLGAVGVYFGSRHWKRIADYHQAASIGAGIAAVQAVVATYIPYLGWVVSDYNQGQYARTTPVLPPDSETPAVVDDSLQDILGNDEFEAVPLHDDDLSSLELSGNGSLSHDDTSSLSQGWMN